MSESYAVTKAPDYILTEWEKFKQSPEFENTRKWLTAQHVDDHVIGSMWACWLAGWNAHKDWGNPDAGDK